MIHMFKCKVNPLVRGYPPNSKSGENSLEMTITNPTASAVGSSSTRHPVGFLLTPDFSSLTMTWGSRLEKRGTLMHTITWNETRTKPDSAAR